MHIDLVKTFIIDWSNHQVMKFYTFKVCTVSVLLVLSPLLVCNITQYVLYDWIFYMNFFGPVQNFEIRLDLVEPKNSKLWLSNWFLGRISLQHIHTTTHLKKNHFLSSFSPSFCPSVSSLLCFRGFASMRYVTTYNTTETSFFSLFFLVLLV